MKKVLSVLLIVTSLFALVGCGGKTENLQKEINALKQSLAELQATVSTQNQTITDQTGKIAELEAAKAAQAETIAALQNSANLSAEEIAALEAQLAEQGETIAEQEAYLAKLLPKGEFCSLETAYNNGLISNENVMKIWDYYRRRNIDTDTYNFVYNPARIDAVTLYAIKQTYIEYEKKSNSNSTTTVNTLYFGAYYGTYGNCIALCLNSPNTYLGDIRIEDKEIGGWVFEDFSIGFIYIWYPVAE